MIGLEVIDLETKQLTQMRTIRAHSILAKGVSPKALDMDTYLIPSQSTDRKYIVRNNGFGFTCECPDFKYRRLDCKHIQSVKMWLKIKERINQQNAFEIQQELASRCVYCYSDYIIKRGKRKTNTGIKQRYLCKNCNRKFVAEPVKKIKGNAKVVGLVLDLYFKGISLRKIQDHLKQFYNLEISHVALYKWIKKFMAIMNRYVDQLQPELSGTWQADEQMVKVNGEWLWNWNVLDPKTRFLIANQVTKRREIKDARKVFQKAKQVAVDQPDEIITDGLQSYNRAIKKEFSTWRLPRTKHTRLAGIRKKRNNNRIERYHGSFRERDKVVRGFKKGNNILTDSYRTYYNFVRPHQALDGKTPSEVADISLDLGNNRWNGLLKCSMENKPIAKRKPRSRTNSRLNHSFVIRIFDKNGNEINANENGYKNYFKTKEKAEEFARFYRNLNPRLRFVISRTILR